MSIIQVAKAAGVSTATVSRVVNELPGVRSETVALVRNAIEELAYKPRRSSKERDVDAPPRPRRRRRSATDLESPLADEVGLRTGSIAVVTVGHGPSWFDRPVLAAALGGIQRGVSELGLRLMLDEMRDPLRPPALLANRQVDGAIVLLSSGASGARTFEAIRSCVPAVWAMGTSVAIDVVDHVTTDNVAVGHLAASHLAGLGCRRMAYLTADPDWPFMRLRGQAFLNWCRDAAIDDVTSYLPVTDARTLMAYSGRTSVAKEMSETIRSVAADARRGQGKLGLFVCNDYTLSYVHPLLAANGLRIGADLEVVSCDAENARLDAMSPKPASINIGADEIGFRAVIRLLARIKRPADRTVSILVAPKI